MTIAKRVLLVLLVCGLGIGNAMADRGDRGHRGTRGHVGVGVTIGPYWGPWYYPPRSYYPPDYYGPYYGPYYAPIVIERPDPPVYIERQTPSEAAPEAAVPETGYWYYCEAARAYYPDVKRCPEGWQKVLPRDADQP